MGGEKKLTLVDIAKWLEITSGALELQWFRSFHINLTYLLIKMRGTEKQENARRMMMILLVSATRLISIWLEVK